MRQMSPEERKYRFHFFKKQWKDMGVFSAAPAEMDPAHVWYLF